MLNRGNPQLSNWYTCAELARMYELLRDLDPHHVTIGAVQSSDLWSFSDGTGALSIDVSMVSARYRCHLGCILLRTPAISCWLRTDRELRHEPG